MADFMLNPLACYAKTPAGVDAVKNRSHGLGPRVRQLLIMIDGKRDLAALQAIFAADVLPGLLTQLTDACLVDLLQTAQPSTDAVGAPERMAVSMAPAAPQRADEDPFVLGQTFMINLAMRILGVAGDPIIARLRATHDVAGLRGLYLEWRGTIKQAPDGLLRLKELEKKLSKVLGELPTP